MMSENQQNKDKDVEDPIKLKEEEKPSKFLRVITVSAYIFSVSFAALMLSLYYIFVWSKSPRTVARHCRIFILISALNS